MFDSSQVHANGNSIQDGCVLCVWMVPACSSAYNTVCPKFKWFHFEEKIMHFFFFLWDFIHDHLFWPLIKRNQFNSFKRSTGKGTSQPVYSLKNKRKSYGELLLHLISRWFGGGGRGTFLVVRWLRFCLAMQGARVWSLVRDLRSHMLWSNVSLHIVTTEPVCHSQRGHAMYHNKRSQMMQVRFHVPQ